MKEIPANKHESAHTSIVLHTASHIIDNRLYVSLHDLCAAFGSEVSYNKKDHTLHVKTAQHHAVFWPGSSVMMLDGSRLEIGSPVVTRKGRMQVPLRFIASMFNWEVLWDNDTILLTRKNDPEQPSVDNQ